MYTPLYTHLHQLEYIHTHFPTHLYLCKSVSHTLMVYFMYSYLHRVARITQSGIFTWMTKERVPRIYGSSDNTEEDAAQEIRIEKRISTTIQVAKSPEPKIRLENVYKLPRIYFICLPIAMIVLWYEFVHDSIRKSKIQNATSTLRATVATPEATLALEANEPPKVSRRTRITTK